MGDRRLLDFWKTVDEHLSQEIIAELARTPYVLEDISDTDHAIRLQLDRTQRAHTRRTEHPNTPAKRVHYFTGTDGQRLVEYTVQDEDAGYSVPYVCNDVASLDGRSVNCVREYGLHGVTFGAQPCIHLDNRSHPLWRSA